MPSDESPATIRAREAVRRAREVAARVAFNARVAPGAIECVECGLVALRYVHGWRAYLTVDDEVAIYCPEHADAEFGSS